MPAAKATCKSKSESETKAPSHRVVTRNVSAAKDMIVEGVTSSLNVVLLTRKTIEDVIEDAVSRGRMTRHDAQDIVQTLLQRGARATSEAVSDLERMVGAGASGEASDQLPIPGYGGLSAAEVAGRLDDLTSDQLRSVRDYERRNANRETVLDPIERKLR